MIKKLLIVKDDKGYLRFSNKGFNHCSMDKASVFPLHSYPEIYQKLQLVRKTEESNAAIFLLTISEEMYEEVPA